MHPATGLMPRQCQRKTLVSQSPKVFQALVMLTHPIPLTQPTRGKYLHAFFHPPHLVREKFLSGVHNYTAASPEINAMFVFFNVLLHCSCKCIMHKMMSLSFPLPASSYFLSLSYPLSFKISVLEKAQNV